jgi:hypothetical protein
MALIFALYNRQLDRLRDKRLQVQAKAGWLRVQVAPDS